MEQARSGYVRKRVFPSLAWKVACSYWMITDEDFSVVGSGA
jgi:hypothetical protein